MFPMANGNRHALAAGFLGWTLDAFDFFVLIFLYDQIVEHFHVAKKEVVFTVTLTLLFRPLGALLFGLLADRYGRRIPLMANVIFYALVELLTGFAPNFTTFLILRALFGIGMGGEWGIGASLAMEHAPVKARGIISGILQSGYSIGYLLAALASREILPRFGPDGWRVMFWIGGLPALLALYIRMKVPESEAWQKHRHPSFSAIIKTVAAQWQSFLYLVLLMTFMMFLSHGTQDLYPDFLKNSRGIHPKTVPNVAIIYNIGAVLGAILFGQFSEKIGRRRSMLAALTLSLCVIPVWSFSSSLVALTIGAFIMQMGVQGAWGIIPVHLNELSPHSVRGLMPGLAYQFGILIAAPTNTIEYALRDRVGYSWALASFEIVTIVSLAIILMFGREEKGREFM